MRTQVARRPFGMSEAHRLAVACASQNLRHRRDGGRRSGGDRRATSQSHSSIHHGPTLCAAVTGCSAPGDADDLRRVGIAHRGSIDPDRGCQIHGVVTTSGLRRRATFAFSRSRTASLRSSPERSKRRQRWPGGAAPVANVITLGGSRPAGHPWLKVHYGSSNIRSSPDTRVPHGCR